MSKERLTQSKQMVESLKKGNEREPIFSSLEIYLMNWLIEQAERVKELEELEQEYVDLNNDFTIMALERKRYREALEFYADEGTYEVVETLPPTDEYQQPIEPVFKTVPIIYYDKGKEARKALEE